VAAERDEEGRQEWHTAAKALDPRRFVVVDESSTTIALTRRYGWARHDERLVAAVPRNHGTPTSLVAAVPRNHGTPTSLVAALTLGGLGPAMTREGAIDTPAFVAYVRDVLGPTLEPGQIVLLDNLSVHKAEAVRSLIEARGCALLFLPPYSPDFSPIEHVFSKIKAFLRQVGARTQEALEEAIRLALDTITPGDARAFFDHCGYSLPAAS
jgi:transposase